jgi:antirestriction protein ArdC
MNRKERADTYAEVQATVLAALESGTAPWHKPWNAGQLPVSLSTHKPYRGINPFLLELTASARGYASPWWGTYDKITELGGQVRKGETKANGKGATMITFMKRLMVDDRDRPGKQRPVFMLRAYRVFNSEQADWPEGKAPTWETPEPNTGERLHDAEMIVKGYQARGGPDISYGGNRAFYVPSADRIACPRFEDHDGPGEFYSTLFHECGHSTGHASRLNRPGIAALDHFGTDRYGKEELVAEMTAAMLSGICGVSSTVSNSAAYLRSWMTTIKGDPKLVVQAAGLAQRAADLIQGISYADRDTDS